MDRFDPSAAEARLRQEEEEAAAAQRRRRADDKRRESGRDRDRHSERHGERERERERERSKDTHTSRSVRLEHRSRSRSRSRTRDESRYRRSPTDDGRGRDQSRGETRGPAPRDREPSLPQRQQHRSSRSPDRRRASPETDSGERRIAELERERERARREREMRRSRSRSRSRSRPRSRSPRRRSRSRSPQREQRTPVQRSHSDDGGAHGERDLPPSTTLLMRGLAPHITDAALRDAMRSYFPAHADAASVRVISDRASGASRGFAFAEFKSIAEAADVHDTARALAEAGSPFMIEGRPVQITFAKESGVSQRRAQEESRHRPTPRAPSPPPPPPRLPWDCTRCGTHNRPHNDACYICNIARVVLEGGAEATAAMSTSLRTAAAGTGGQAASALTPFTHPAHYPHAPLHTVPYNATPAAVPASAPVVEELPLIRSISSGTVLLLSRLPPSSTPSSVRDALVPFTAVVDVLLLLDEQTGLPLPQAFVQLESTEECQALLAKCAAGDGQPLLVAGQPVELELAGPTHLTLATHTRHISWLAESSAHVRHRLTAAVAEAAVQHAGRRGDGDTGPRSWSQTVAEQTALYAPALAAAHAATPQRPASLAATFQFDPASGQWFDAATGYWFQPATQLYYHAASGYSRWDPTLHQYVPVVDPHAQTHHAAQSGLSDAAAQYLAMKTLGQAQGTTTAAASSAVAPATSAAPISFSFNTSAARTHGATSALAGSSTAAAATAASASMSSVPPSAAAAAASSDPSFLDPARLACLLCNRQLKTLEQLLKHEQKSELHKSNLEAWRAANTPATNGTQPAAAPTATSLTTAATAKTTAATTDAAANAKSLAAAEYLRQMESYRSLDHDEQRHAMLNMSSSRQQQQQREDAASDEAASAVGALQLHDGTSGGVSRVDDDEEASLSLSAHFYKCQRLYTGLMVTGNIPRTLAACTDLRRSLLSLLRRVEMAGVFSSNESAADDLSTPAIKFMLVPFFLGQLASSFPCDITQRVQHVKAAGVYFAQFMRRLDSYGLIDDGAEMDEFTRLNKELGAALSAPPASAAAAAASSRPGMRGMGGRGGDPNAIRNAKIARMRRTKELNTQLEALQQSRTSSYHKRKQSANTIGASTQATDGDDLSDELLDGGADEATIRSFYLLLLQQSVVATVDAMRSALEESAMLIHHRDVELRRPKSEQLAHMEPEVRREEARDSGAKLVAHRMTPDALNQPIPGHMKHLLQNVVQPALSSAASAAAASSSASAAVSALSALPVANSIDRVIASRSQARDQVFALTNQPTYSIEQWADMEIAAGRLPGPSNEVAPRGPDPRRIRSQADRDIAEEMVEAWKATAEESEELGHEDGAAGQAKDELKTMKDREWDNWKDDHQKGIGNSMK